MLAQSTPSEVFEAQKLVAIRNSLLTNISPDGRVRLTLKISHLKILLMAHKADDTFSVSQDAFHLVSLCLEYCGKKKERVKTPKRKPMVIY